ncbi:Integral membrane protein TerC [Helicobacter heilmannii]|uniref:TerC/Alx family metal homeostasis membrane protein n=1 Tax=Helicobacter heilmannii TaxID=35817 RepID=UPI0006A02758|nr:TerC/Alx family metal homeostasis membrane protein [Helicobacter heilmannii]CRF49625.1 Integral membrane protein TerC [Helicobacter heilmannii]
MGLDLIVFLLFMALALFIDFKAHSHDQVMGLKSAIGWSLFWVATALLFAAYLYWHDGSVSMSLFLTGYVLEKALSVDNLFVMMAIFAWFKVPEIYRHRVLYYGIIGAIVFRLIFVLVGSGLMHLSAYVEIVFGLLVGYSCVVMVKNQEKEEDTGEEDYSKHLAYRLVYKFFPVYPKLVGHDFFIKKEQLSSLERNLEGQEASELHHQSAFAKARLVATPLFLCLAVIELSDVMFAFDSVPAVIAVSKEPLIIYSAMMFAILGLRSLYFVLEVLKGHLIYLEKSVIVVLAFISLKLILAATDQLFGVGVDISPTISLYIVLGVLGAGVLLSLFKGKQERAPTPSSPDHFEEPSVETPKQEVADFTHTRLNNCEHKIQELEDRVSKLEEEKHKP